VQGMLFQNMFYSHMQGLQETNPGWYVLLDFISVAVFAWFYDRVYSSFGGNMQGGMKFGLYAGVFLTFPTMFFPFLMYSGIPYTYVWASTVYGIIWATILGTVVGKIYTKETTTQSA